MASWHTLHFNKIAKVIRDKRSNISTKEEDANDYYWNDGGQVEKEHEALLNELTLEFAEYFKEQNDNFDTDKFIEACGFRKEG